MAIRHTEYWTERAACPECSDYIWSQPTSGNCQCLCGFAMIQNHVRTAGNLVLNEITFEQYGCEDLGYEFGEVMFIHESPP